MNKTENKIKKAFTAITPDILEAVVSDSAEKKGTVMYMKQKRSFTFAFVAAAAAFVLLFGVLAGVLVYTGNNAVASVVSIDVNPSIEIKLNKKDVVVEINALNEDGQKIIGNMDLVGTDIEVALNALVGSMVMSGYITETQNSVLISVENENSRKNQRLREKLNNLICMIFENKNSQCAVITQKVENDDEEIRLFAENLGVSLGKAQIIRELCAHNSQYTAEALAELGINELTLLLESLGAKINGELSGAASDQAYIEKEVAVDAAIEFLGLPKDTVIKKQKASLDFDDGIMIYEVEIVTEQIEYEVEVNALTGEIVSSEKDILDFIISEGYVLSEGDIKDIIIKNYGLPAKNIPMDMELQRSDGYLIYEVEFVYQGVEYEFEITATRGEVISYKYSVPGNNQNDDPLISESQALDIALSHVNLTRDDITELEIESEEDDGVFEYEIEFKSGYYFYEIKVDGKKSSVIEYEREVHEKYKKLTLVGTTGNIYAIKVKINPGGGGICSFQEIYEPMEPKLGYVDGSYGEQSFNEWITKYTPEWFEENRLFLGDCIADGQIEIEGIYVKYTYSSTNNQEESQLLLVYNQLTKEERIYEEDGSFYGYYFLLELPKEDYPEEYFTSGFGRGAEELPEDATKYY